MPTFPSAGRTIQDGASLAEVIVAIRQMQTAQNRNLASIQREQLGDPARKDRREANALYTRGGPVRLDIANQPAPGDVLYAVNKTQAAWGTAAAPAPTDPGTGPNVGSPHPLLDGVQNNDTVAQTPSRGSLIYGNSTPKWDELVKPASASILGNDATDAAWITKTATDQLDQWSWLLAPGVGTPTLSSAGTFPAAYYYYDFPTGTLSEAVAFVRVPARWVSGAVTVTVLWTTAGGGSGNWVPQLNLLEAGVGTALNGAATTTDATALSGVVTAHQLQSTTITTFTPSSATNMLRIGIARKGSGLDTFNGGIRFLGFRLSYTPAY